MILVIDNYDSFTWNLVQALGTLAPEREIRVVRNDKIDADEAERMGPSHLIVSPGPCTPVEAGASVEIIRRLAGRVPILGVCLGHQCIGAAFGMRVSRHAVVMHGKTSRIEHDGRGVLAGIESPLIGARYHSLVVEAGSVPGGEWEVSAWIDEEGGGGARVVMGLRRKWERAPLEGVQFHPESFMTPMGGRIVANFLVIGAGVESAPCAAGARARGR